MTGIAPQEEFFEGFLPEDFNIESMEERFKGLLEAHKREEAKKEQLDLLMEGLKDRKKTLESFLSGVEGELKALATKMAVTKVFRDGSTFMVRDSESLMYEEDLIPEEYLIKTVSFKPDTNKIKKALKSGLTIEGVTPMPLQKIKIMHQ